MKRKKVFFSLLSDLIKSSLPLIITNKSPINNTVKGILLVTAEGKDKALIVIISLIGDEKHHSAI